METLRDKEPTVREASSKTTIIVAAILPYAFCVIMYFMAPGWTIMLLSFKPLMVGLAVWHLLGMFFLTRANARTLKMTAFLVFVFPLLLSPLTIPFYVAYLQPCNMSSTLVTPTTGSESNGDTSTGDNH